MLFLVIVLAASVIVSLFRGGKLANLPDIYARGWLLLILGFGMQIVGNRLGEDQHELAVALVLISYVPLLLVAALNRTSPGMWIAGIGILMNFIVMAANGGMPVLPEAVELAGGDATSLTAFSAKHVLLDSTTRFPFLADIIPLPGSVISLGDVFFAIGLGVFIEDQLQQPLRLFRHRVQGIPGSAAER
ncbi:MAG: DUF5317 domain-containing protein [Acidimicrobiia bacterium]|nr:DUF5317 domain-containing protein [Acidimicrobiia bacterium]